VENAALFSVSMILAAVVTRLRLRR